MTWRCARCGAVPSDLVRWPRGPTAEENALAHLGGWECTGRVHATHLAVHGYTTLADHYLTIRRPVRVFLHGVLGDAWVPPAPTMTPAHEFDPRIVTQELVVVAGPIDAVGGAADLAARDWYGCGWGPAVAAVVYAVGEGSPDRSVGPGTLACVLRELRRFLVVRAERERLAAVHDIGGPPAVIAYLNALAGSEVLSGPSPRRAVRW